MTSPEPIDDRIRAALRGEVDDLLRDLDEPGIVSRTITAVRRGPRWVTVYLFVVSLGLTAWAVYSVVRLLGAEETRGQVLWAVSVLASLQVITAIKAWFWMQMEKYVLLREVKRMEWQVAGLAERLGKG
ncbi:MAG: hypothetical protein HRU70_08595 [Phycisphaeraceae bacterium]|nr:MAG: hypothetical protein HRU70_08595 [Phycisphaeraceae bacterium]